MSAQSIVTDEVWDLTVVGAGPVGMTLALLLAAQGHRVLVLEKHDRPYGLPRAVHFTPDISRLLDQLGVMDAVNEFAHEAKTYDWQNAARQTLISFGPTGDEKQGWPWSTMFNQPGLEKQLLTKVEAHPNVTLAWSAEATSVSQSTDAVELGVTIDGSAINVSSRFVVGCDGAKSFVRTQIDTTVNDLGFFYDWLVIDIVEHSPRVWEPECLQICDPVRPVSVVSGGPGKRRFEFMRTETDGDDFVSEQSCWDLMAPWEITPDNTRIERFRLYSFQSRWADNWFDGRVGIAGDAAHQVPPFFGVGLVSGMRDAANLAWKFDLVLSGYANLSLLDSYTSERVVEVQNAIGMSVELGKVICELDPDKVAARDAHFLATGPNPENSLPPVPPERLGPGVLFDDAPLTAPNTGVYSVNERVADASGATVLLDQLNYGSFKLVVDAQRVSEADARQALTHVPDGVRLLMVRLIAGTEVSGPLSSFTDAVPGVVVTLRDSTGVMLANLASSGYACELVRPDFVVFGGSDSPENLVATLSARVHGTPVPA